MRRCCSVASTALHLVKEIALQCWLFYLGGIIIFLSDKSRPNRVRTEGSGANWGMRCGDGALHLGLRDRGTRAGCWLLPPRSCVEQDDGGGGGNKCFTCVKMRRHHPVKYQNGFTEKSGLSRHLLNNTSGTGGMYQTHGNSLIILYTLQVFASRFSVG